MTPLILYHANCADGFCAAWVAHGIMPNAEFIPVQYGQEPPSQIAGRRVYILDFSYKREVMRKVLGQAIAVTVLDHHKTAEAELAGIADEFVQRPDLIANRPGSELPVIHFDMSKSGGRLAWEHFYAPERGYTEQDREHFRPWLVDYTEDRDLWRWRLPWSKEISAFIASHPFDFKLWDSWSHFRPGFDGPNKWDCFVDQGAAILRYQQQLVDRAVENANEIEMNGHKVLSVNSTVLFSEIAGKLAEGRPFGVAWFERQDGKRQYSLRSREGGVDVSEIARLHGGGGHKHAAGFEVSQN